MNILKLQEFDNSLQEGPSPFQSFTFLSCIHQNDPSLGKWDGNEEGVKTEVRLSNNSLGRIC